MRYASSVRYGGQIISAVDCDYQSYKNLGLLCPNCKDAVFFQGQSSRALEQKIISIPPHFKHFAAKDPALVQQCEARVAKYDAKELLRRATSVRNQRLKLLHRWFWQIFTVHHDSLATEAEKSIDQMKVIQFESGLILSLEEQFTKLLDCQTAFKTEARSLVAQISDQTYLNRISKSGEMTEKAVAILKSLCARIDYKMHDLIIGEIIDFLFAKSSRHLLFLVYQAAILYVCSYEDTKKWANNSLESAEFYEIIAEPMCMKLVEIPWAEEFAKLT